MINSKLPKIFYGSDYNPEQWPEEIWKEDMRLSKMAGINILTLPVFSWAKLQPEEEEYDFEWLDKVILNITSNNIYLCFATSTAAQPAWMSKKYPEMLPVDFEGRKRSHGGRVNFCPNSTKYRELSVKLVEKLVDRYSDNPYILIWHIGNEYGKYCYCDTCAAAFRNWLKDKYGTLQELNRSWNMNFWGHTIYDWDEIVVPSALSEMWNDNGREKTCFQGISLDYKRFMSDSSLACYLGEYNTIKKKCPDIPVTTNFMGTFKPLDYSSWAKHIDVIAWDNYPIITDPPSITAFKHDQMRGLKDGQPFMLMEQTPSQQNWSPYNSLKRPGVMRLWSYQAIAHGADTVMFFQLRRSIGACEKFHGAVIAHAGHENTRVFRECCQLGKELEKLGDKILDSRVKSKVAIVFDWNNWWALEFSSPTKDMDYIKQIEKYYSPLFNANISVDIISPDSDFSLYEIIIAPVLYMVKSGIAKKFENFVAGGGIFITTFFSGIVDEKDLVYYGGYPGELRKLLGVWVEEIDVLVPEMKNTICFEKRFDKLNGSYECNMLFDLINLEGATALAVYGSDFYAGRPALTVNDFGKGKAYYIATNPNEQFLTDFLLNICGNKGIKSPFDPIKGVEVTQRFKESQEFTFILNHNDTSINMRLNAGKYTELLSNEIKCGEIILEAKGVAILERMEY